MTADGVVPRNGTAADIAARKAAEAALRESEERAAAALAASESRHRFLFENMLAGYAYCRLIVEDGQPTDFAYLHVNAAFETLTGLKNVVGRRVSELIPGLRQTNPELFEIYGRVASTGRPERFETFVEPLAIWFSVSVYRPEPGCFVAVFDNITERKAHEREIERLGQLYSTLSGISSLIVRVKSREELFRDACRIAADHAGFRMVWIGWIDHDTHAVRPVGHAGDRKGYLDTIKVFADDRPEGRGPVGTCIRSNQPSIFNDFLHDPRAAAWRDAAAAQGLQAVAALPIHLGGAVCGAFSVYADEKDFFQPREVALLAEVAATISFGLETLDREERRKLAEHALRESEARYRRIVETAAEGIWSVDADLRTTFVNEAFARMLGYSPEEMLGVPAESFTFPEDLAEFRNHMSIRREGLAEHYERRFRRKDGRECWCQVSGTPVLDSDGRFAGSFGMLTDVTDHRLLEEQLRQAQKMEAIGQLAGGVAHDFNNLLTVISGNIELLLSGASVDDPKRSPLVDIRSAGERAANLTRQLLAFSRKQILEPRLVDVNEVVAGIEKLLGRLIGEDVDLATDLAADPAWIKVDPGQLEQVVMNLVVNARDAMPRGGRLTIRTRNVAPSDPDDHDDTAGRQLRARVAIAISDTGSGISPEVRAHLFEPFFTTKAVGKGTGLGLATVYGIVKQSGGDVTVESEPGKGATFTVILPAQPAPRRNGDSGASHRAAPRGTETVLVVEDEAAVRHVVTIVLESAGYRVIAAASGPEALETVSRHPDEIHLVVTDVVMPEMSGRELAARVVKDHPGIRVLYMSGYMDDAVMRHGITESGVAFLQKPFTPVALARKVREVLDAESVPPP